MRKAVCRLIYRVLHYVYIIITVHSISISDERTCTVNTVPLSLRLITVELICSQVLLTCICAELRVDCLEEERSFIRRLRNCYSVKNKDIINIRGWQKMHDLCIYCCTVTDSILQCVFTVYSVVWSLYFFSSSAIHLL